MQAFQVTEEVSESDDEVPDLVDCSEPVHGKTWFAVLVGRVPGVFNMRSVRSFMRAIFFSYLFSGLRLLTFTMPLATRSFTATRRQRQSIFSTLRLMLVWLNALQMVWLGPPWCARSFLLVLTINSQLFSLVNICTITYVTCTEDFRSEEAVREARECDCYTNSVGFLQRRFEFSSAVYKYARAIDRKSVV